MLHNSSCCVFSGFKSSVTWPHHFLQEVNGRMFDGEVKVVPTFVLVQDSVESMQSIDSCEYIWEAGVGFAQSPPLNYIHDLNR